MPHMGRCCHCGSIQTFAAYRILEFSSGAGWTKGSGGGDHRATAKLYYADVGSLLPSGVYEIAVPSITVKVAASPYDSGSGLNKMIGWNWNERQNPQGELFPTETPHWAKAVNRITAPVILSAGIVNEADGSQPGLSLYATDASLIVNDVTVATVTLPTDDQKLTNNVDSIDAQYNGSVTGFYQSADIKKGWTAATFELASNLDLSEDDVEVKFDFRGEVHAATRLALRDYDQAPWNLGHSEYIELAWNSAIYTPNVRDIELTTPQTHTNIKAVPPPLDQQLKIENLTYRTGKKYKVDISGTQTKLPGGGWSLDLANEIPRLCVTSEGITGGNGPIEICYTPTGSIYENLNSGYLGSPDTAFSATAYKTANALVYSDEYWDDIIDATHYATLTSLPYNVTLKG